MIFLAVGTQFGFDRLTKALDEAIERGEVRDTIFAQIGPGTYLPRHMEYVASLEKEAFEKTVNTCEAMISHAGMGNISLAIKMNKPLLVMPRCKQYGEVVNNHQIDTANKFETLGHILVAYNEGELAEKIDLLKTFTPRPRIPNRQRVTERIKEFLRDLDRY